jgi:UDP-N-acetylmuramoyl-tripeptide--D-alanyl-D-alanine ligase
LTGVSLDSRSASPGDLFIAIRGETSDGHTYLANAVANGASGLLVMTPPAEIFWDVSIILVNDTMEALRSIARFHRKRYLIPTIALTGSVGKTTAKGMTYSIMSRLGSTLTNYKNYNGQTGVPLTLLRLNETFRYAVIEVGMSFAGEIARLAPIIIPNIAILLNVRPVHLMNFPSIEGIRDAKAEILTGLPPNGTAILNADDPHVTSLRNRLSEKVITFGIDQPADLSAQNITLDSMGRPSFLLSGPAFHTPICLNCAGRHNVYNALAAAAAAVSLDVKPDDIAEGLHDFTSDEMRGQLLHLTNGIRILNDCYNAGPDSMRAALTLLTDMQSSGRRIAVLADMLELGPDGEAFHREVGRLVAELKINRLYTYGQLARHIQDAAIAAGLPFDRTLHSENHAQIVDTLVKTVQPSDIILIKGSRGMAMERVAEGFIQGYSIFPVKVNIQRR